MQQDAGRGWRRLNGLHGTIATGLEKQQAETPAAFLVILMTLLRLCGWGLTVDVELKPFTLNPIDVSRRNPWPRQSRRREPTHARRDDIMMIRSTCADLPFARERPAKHGGRGTLSLVLCPCTLPSTDRRACPDGRDLVCQTDWRRTEKPITFCGYGQNLSPSRDIACPILSPTSVPF